MAEKAKFAIPSLIDQWPGKLAIDSRNDRYIPYKVGLAMNPREFVSADRPGFSFVTHTLQSQDDLEAVLTEGLLAKPRYSVLATNLSDHIDFSPGPVIVCSTPNVYTLEFAKGNKHRDTFDWTNDPLVGIDWKMAKKLCPRGYSRFKLDTTEPFEPKGKVLKIVPKTHILAVVQILEPRQKIMKELHDHMEEYLTGKVQEQELAFVFQEILKRQRYKILHRGFNMQRLAFHLAAAATEMKTLFMIDAIFNEPRLEPLIPEDRKKERLMHAKKLLKVRPSYNFTQQIVARARRKLASYQI